MELTNKILNAIRILEKDKDSTGFHIATHYDLNNISKYYIKVEITKLMPLENNKENNK